jgi:3-hydroxyacyl-CoA dehydrogenase / enoyl-CoA hydratase / 3-hydroxybutyryl-CoA epimerase
MGENMIRWDRDDDGIVVLTIDDPDASANTMTDAFKAELHDVVSRLKAARHEIAGVILASGKPTFFAGGNLQRLRSITAAERDLLADSGRHMKADLRRLETLGVPVVAAINGAALGGGFELCLAAHYRVALDLPDMQIGLPEVTLGLLPGGGGIVRSVRRLGVVDALGMLLLRGTRHPARVACELGLIDELVQRPEQLLDAAKRWITSLPRGAQVRQPWDEPEFVIPGGTPSIDEVTAQAPATVRRQLQTGRYPALANIIAVAVDGAQVSFEEASEIETVHFADLVVGQVAKNMIQAYFFDMQRVKGDRGRRREARSAPVTRCVVLGAGMMGAGIAYVCAKAGIEVVLKDLSPEAAERGKRYSERILTTAIERGATTKPEAEALLSRITPTAEARVAEGVELLVEAVFEDPELKANVLAEIEPHLADDALLATNTSTLPITELADAVARPADFIGLHFFSPVDRMALVEVIRGGATSERTLGRALDLARQIGKTPIVVNDSRGFFTSRVIRSFLNEGIAMLLDGVPPTAIERASTLAGYPAPVLQLRDELNLKLTADIRDAERDAAVAVGLPYDQHPAFEVIDRMIAAGRAGRAAGAGFYDYADGKRLGLWGGLADLFGPFSDAEPDLIALQQRMLAIESLEAVRCIDEGVIESVADANVGSLLGIGFPGWTGGVLQYINGYDGGLPGFVARVRQLAAAHGNRFAPPQSLVAKSERGDTYSDARVATAAR